MHFELAFSQDLEPRRWTPLPVGTNIVGLGYGSTNGDLFFDPLLEIEDAEVDVDTVGLTYVRSFLLAGKLARFDALIPWQSASWDGLLSGEPASTERTGFADPRFRLSINLMGAPEAGSVEPVKQKKSHQGNTVVGSSIAVSVPLGKYYEDKLLNLGQNRYSIRPQIGMVHTRGPWSYELTGSMFFFTDNNDFFNGNKRKQDPLYAVQSHIVRTFKPGLWASLSAGYGWGGESTLNGEKKDDEKGNFISAFSFGFPVARKQAMKVAYVHSRTQKDTGSDTDTLVLAWSMMF